MDDWVWIPVGLLLLGVILAVATTTSNKWRWAVLAPIAFGTGALVLAVIYRDWGPIAVTAGMYFYAAINFRNLRKPHTGLS
jgi:hypothetical protein